MTYHDNDVQFFLDAGYTLISGSYTMDSFYITSGQDPDHHIKAGMTVNCDGSGVLTFSVGRSGSSQTAAWFNGRANANQNTFNHSAGDLNFAFQGTLVLTVTGGALQDKQDTFTFRNVLLAQGHSGTSNNWWYGGQNCTYIQNNQVSCPGSNSEGVGIAFAFQRGGNAANGVNVIPALPPMLAGDTSN